MHLTLAGVGRESTGGDPRVADRRLVPALVSLSTGRTSEPRIPSPPVKVGEPRSAERLAAGTAPARRALPSGVGRAGRQSGVIRVFAPITPVQAPIARLPSPAFVGRKLNGSPRAGVAQDGRTGVAGGGL